MASDKRFLTRELEDDAQAAVLYSPFREKTLNPQSWTRKMKFWENILAQTALEEHAVTFDVNMLPQMFDRKGMRPKCLGTVVAELKKSGRIRPVEDYKRVNSWLSWGFTALVKQPLAWGVGRLLGSAYNESGVYVWPEVVMKLSEEVIALHMANVQNELTHSLFSMAYVRSLCQSLIPSDQDFEIVLVQLERDKKILIAETPDKEMVVKFCNKGESSVSPIRDTDLHVYRLQTALGKLEEEIEMLSSKAEGQLTEVRTHLREGRRTMAKLCLRKQKAILRMIDKKSGSHVVLHDALQSIEDASTNDMVVKACQAGLAVVKNLNKDMTVEGVESTLDNLREAMENQEEINQVLSSSLSPDDNEQLEQDLEQLLYEAVTEVKVDRDKNKPTASKEYLDEELSELLQGSLRKTQLRPGSSSAHSLQSGMLDDLGLPEVPSHSPYHASPQDKTRSTSQPLSS